VCVTVEGLLMMLYVVEGLQFGFTGLIIALSIAVGLLVVNFFFRTLQRTGQKVTPAYASAWIKRTKQAAKNKVINLV